MPRRMRRKYSTPKNDLDITNYSAYRIYNIGVYKEGTIEETVV